MLPTREVQKLAEHRASPIVRAVVVACTAICCAVALVAVSSMSTASRLLTNALIMGGTFMPTPDQAFVDMAIRDFIAPALRPTLDPYHGATVSYPASGGIIPGGPTINRSVAIGVDNLDRAIAEQPAGQPVVAFGFSQSTVVTMIEKARLAERKARGESVPEVVFVGIGVGNRPHGGIASLLGGITIPFVDFTFNGPAPTDPEFGFTTIDIAREYDGLADFPVYPVNLLADLNAVLGILFVHARYDQVSLDPASPKYVPGTVRQQYGDTTYYHIPTPNLPLFDPLRIIGVPEALIDVVEPVAEVIVDAGYDRTIPFGQPTPLRLVPRIDPVKFTTDLAHAAGAGLANAVKIFTPPKAEPHQHDSAVEPGDDVDAQQADPESVPRRLNGVSTSRMADRDSAERVTDTADETDVDETGDDEADDDEAATEEPATEPEGAEPTDDSAADES